MNLSYSNARACSGAAFNSGVSACAFEPGKIKALILTQHGVSLPATLSASELEKACHADRPNRIYPIKMIVNYEPNGGEVQTQDVGYGPTKISGYSAKADTWTLDNYDENLRQCIANAKGARFDMFLVDDENVIYGMRENDTIVGIPLAGVAFGGQSFSTADAQASLTVTTYYQDWEAYVKDATIVQADFDVVEAVNGLVFVDFVNGANAGGYKLVEHYSRTDITAIYGQALATAGTSAIDMTGTPTWTYDTGANELHQTGGTGDPTLKAPSVLQGLDILGIEGW